jgi:SEC-C motif
MIPVQAIEVLVEQMAAGAALTEPTSADTSSARDAAQASSHRDNAASPELEAQGQKCPCNASDSNRLAAGQPHGMGRRKQREQEQKHPPRNRPCPCGSKAKHKNCCGSAARLQKQSAASSDVDARALGMPQQLLV